MTIFNPVSAVLKEESFIGDSSIDPRIATNVSCGDTITANAVLTTDILNCPGNGLHILADDVTIDCQGHRITGTNQTGSGVFTTGTNQHNLVVKNCIIENFFHGISVSGQNNTIINNTLLINARGIFVTQNPVVQSNRMINNTITGIQINGFTNNMIVTQNIITGSGTYGAYFTSADNNHFFENNISSNSKGIFLERSSNNNITRNFITDNTIGIDVGSGGPVSVNNLIHDNFFNNALNARDQVSTQLWNTTKTSGTNIIGGPYLGGNYWSDYNGTDTDGDGLGDTLLPYNSNGNIINGGDFAPLVPSLCGSTTIQDITLNSDILSCPGNGIIIGDDDITLDCQGHTITGSGTGSGILAQNRQNITIKNCIVQNFFYGIELDSTNQSLLLNNTADNNNDGFRLSGSSNSNIFTDNTANNNNAYGFFLLQSSNNNTFTNNTAENNERGFFLYFSPNNTLKSNTADSNADLGFFLDRSSNNILPDNTA